MCSRDNIEVHEGPIIKHILVQGEKAKEAMDEMHERLGLVEFYSTPTLEAGD